MTAFFALIPAAGVGQRAGSTVPKQYAPLLGRPMLMHAIAAFAAARSITATHVVVSPADQWIETVGGSGFPAGCNIHRVGGATRAASVLNGLNAIEANANDWVLSLFGDLIRLQANKNGFVGASVNRAPLVRH